MSQHEDEVRARGIPEDWVEFFARLWRWVDEVTDQDKINTMAEDGQPRLAVRIDDLRVLLTKAEEGVRDHTRADQAVAKALESAGRSEERLKATLRLQGELQERLQEAEREATERACAAVCERCAKYGPATWSTRGALHPPGHPEHDPEDGQWWHDDTLGDIPGDGWCAAQSIRRAFQEAPSACTKGPGTECACRECQEAEQKLREQGPHGPGSCRECGGYNVRWDLGPAWRVDCVDCGNGGPLPLVISPGQGVDKK
ncbi:MAG TPA: hypothetical protein VLL48_10750 [Longimicrobiales bacterium]|nr:hypothetical protein [Longimicrobiales bacterium]